MRTKSTKAEFVNETKERIAMRETLCDFYYNTYLPTLKKFNGKVYNIRFIKALRESQFKAYFENKFWVDQTLKALLNDTEMHHEDKGCFKYSELISLLCELQACPPDCSSI